MAEIKVIHIGNKRTSIIYTPTNSVIVTDTPKSNGGKGELISPPDLFAASLASCALTVMGKIAENQKDSFENAVIDVDKVIADNPHRVDKIILNVTLPACFDEKKRKLYVGAIKACPVYNSLSPNLKVEINIL